MTKDEILAELRSLECSQQTYTLPYTLIHAVIEALSAQLEAPQENEAKARMKDTGSLSPDAEEKPKRGRPRKSETFGAQPE